MGLVNRIRILEMHDIINSCLRILDEIMQLHPDVKSSDRYVAGTKMQMRKKSTSHKKLSCRYHDVSLTKQGVTINTMNQVTKYEH